MGESFEQLRAEFLDESEDTLGRLQEDLNRLASGTPERAPDAELVDRLFRATHSLKGVAGMFGLDEFSAVAHAMENALEGVRRGDVPVDSETADRLHLGLETLDRLRSAAAGDEGRDAGGAARRAIRALEDHLAAHTAAVGTESRRACEPVAVICERLNPEERDALGRAARGGLTLALVTWRTEEAHFETAYRKLVEGIRGWGTLHGSTPVNERSDAGSVDVRVLASGAEGIFHLLKRIGPLGADADECESCAVLSALEGELSPATVSTAPPPTPAPSPTPVAPGAPEASPAPAPAGSSTLRVPVERVDRLLSELGDVVQAQLGLEATARDALESIPDRVRRTLLTQSLRNLDRRVRALREEVLRIRMVALRPLFRKLERTVRETARATGKSARLETRGDDEELDKTVVEALLHPLVHLVRNAVDHGLESPERRRELGKSPEGTIRVEARREGHQTVVEVADDGQGIDWPAVRTRAIRSGLLAAGDDPPIPVLQGVLFRPGFSVRDEVTEISGRGVGLDAVRDAVARLGGILEIVSSERGTMFRLRVPTTLALSRCLRVEAGGEIFFLPLACVARVERLAVDSIERDGDEEILLQGDRVVPVRDLGAMMGRRPVGRSGGRVPAVVVGVAERRVVLLVDHLAGQHEIVARALSELLPAVPGIAGSTELGDGRAVLILDPAALLPTYEASTVATRGGAG